MRQKKPGKIFNQASLYFEKRKSEKGKKKEKSSVVIFTVRYTIIIGISVLALLMNFLKNC